MQFVEKMALTTNRSRRADTTNSTPSSASASVDPHVPQKVNRTNAAPNAARKSRALNKNQDNYIFACKPFTKPTTKPNTKPNTNQPQIPFMGPTFITVPYIRFLFQDYQEEGSTLGLSTHVTVSWKAAPSTRLHAYEAAHLFITAIKYTVLCLAALRGKAVFIAEKAGWLACMEWAALAKTAAI